MVVVVVVKAAAAVTAAVVAVATAAAAAAVVVTAAVAAPVVVKAAAVAAKAVSVALTAPVLAAAVAAVAVVVAKAAAAVTAAAVAATNQPRALLERSVSKQKALHAGLFYVWTLLRRVSVFTGLALQDAVKPTVGQQSQQFGDHTHLPRNDAIDCTRLNSFEGLVGKGFRAH